MLRSSSGSYASIGDGQSESNHIRFESFASGILHIPDGWTTADIGFKVSMTANGNYQPMYGSDGSLIVIPSATAGRSYAIPSEVFAATYIRLWSNALGVSENQVSGSLIGLSVKA